MNLPTASKDYDFGNEANTRAQLIAADALSFKKGQDVYLIQGERLILSSASGIIAHAGGGQAGAMKLTKAINLVATVATAADSVALLPAKAGMTQIVINRGANACQVFGTSPDTINGAATGTGVSLAANAVGRYHCPVDGQWFG